MFSMRLRFVDHDMMARSFAVDSGFPRDAPGGSSIAQELGGIPEGTGFYLIMLLGACSDFEG